MKDYLLCADCEKLFNDNGERYVMSQVADRKGFPLLATLQAATPTKVAAGFSWYDQLSVPAVDRSKLGYFALSMFWRGAVHSWKGYRTRGRRRAPFRFAEMTEVGIREVVLNEWVDAHMLTTLALRSGVEGDSEGSLLSRAALIVLYAMLDAELAIAAQWQIAEDRTRFEEAEVNFLNEVAIGIGHDGEVTVQEDRQSFKQRIISIPRVLARRAEGRDVQINLGKRWGEQLLQGHEVRNKLIHLPVGESVPRVSLTELLEVAGAVRSYFAELSSVVPQVFGVHAGLLDRFKLPSRKEVERNLSAARKLRKSRGIARPIPFPH